MRVAYLSSVVDRRLPDRRAAATIHALAGTSVRHAALLLAERPARDACAALAAAEQTYSAEMGAGAGTLLPEEGRLLYALTRALTPDLVVETGTANGSSALFLLSALDANGSGRLLSIDLPFVGHDRTPVVADSEIGEYDASPIPRGRTPGWIVTERLRERWELRFGDSAQLLPVIDGPADLFFHDSLHSRDHMLMEFSEAWRMLRTGGVLAADDVFQRRHDALASFASDHGRTFRTFGHLGFIVR